MRVIVKNKKGFTLVELLATIAILAILVVFVVPEVYDLLKRGEDETFILQEKEVLDAAVLYIEDYCKSPISSGYTCKLQYEITDEGFIVYFGTLKLKTIVDAGYIGSVSFKNKPCTDKSYIVVNSKYDEVNKKLVLDETRDTKAYLKCINSDDDNSPFVSKKYSEDEFNAAK